MLSVAKRQPCNLQNAAILPVPCLSPARPCPCSLPSRVPISLPQAGPSQPPARAAGPGGTCVLQTWHFWASPGGSWDPNLCVLVAAAVLGAVPCVPGISLILGVGWGLAQQSAHAALPVCASVQVWDWLLKRQQLPVLEEPAASPTPEPSEAP